MSDKNNKNLWPTHSGTKLVKPVFGIKAVFKLSSSKKAHRSVYFNFIQFSKQKPTSKLNVPSRH